MIRGFRHRGLRDLFMEGKSARLQPLLHERCKKRLNVLRNARTLKEVNVQGFQLHKLRGNPPRYLVHVNGPWCITFGWDDATGEAYDLDLVNYH
jgi:proteic killer suppression protein